MSKCNVYITIAPCRLCLYRVCVCMRVYACVLVMIHKLITRVS